MKQKLAVVLLIAGPLIIASGFNILFGIAGACIALGVIIIAYGVILIHS